jgi:hypothetical protein
MLHEGWMRALAMGPAILWHLASTIALRAKNLLRKVFFGIHGESFPDVAKATAHVEQFIEQWKLVDRIVRDKKD